MPVLEQAHLEDTIDMDTSTHNLALLASKIRPARYGTDSNMSIDPKESIDALVNEFESYGVYDQSEKSMIKARADITTI